ncbi:MAG: hypothetical protein RMK18_12030, partial [Armatimonadota bacterium]|nr:hypothetical protein [Armatimonadota bacterium]
QGGIVYKSELDSEAPNEFEVPEFSEVDKVLRERYRQILDKADVALIQTEPDLPTLHAFSIPLQSGIAFVFVNASDEPVAFTADCTSHIRHHQPRFANNALRIAMNLGSWQAGLIAVDNQGRIFVAEGSGQIFVNGELIAEGKGHFALVSDGDADLRGATRLWLFPYDTTTITVRRKRGAPVLKVAEVSEWRNGERKVLERVSAKQHINAVTVKVVDDLKGEVALLF